MVAGASIALTIVLWLVFPLVRPARVIPLSCWILVAYLTSVASAMDLAKVDRMVPPPCRDRQDAIERRPHSDSAPTPL